MHGAISIPSSHPTITIETKEPPKCKLIAHWLVTHPAHASDSGKAINFSQKLSIPVSCGVSLGIQGREDFVSRERFQTSVRLFGVLLGSGFARFAPDCRQWLTAVPVKVCNCSCPGHPSRCRRCRCQKREPDLDLEHTVPVLAAGVLDSSREAAL